MSAKKRKERSWEDVPFPSGSSRAEERRLTVEEEDEDEVVVRGGGRPPNVARLHESWARCGDAFTSADVAHPANWKSWKPVARCLTKLQRCLPGDADSIISSPGTSSGSCDESPDADVAIRRRSRGRGRVGAGSLVAEQRLGAAQASAYGRSVLRPAMDDNEDIESVESEDALPLDSPLAEFDIVDSERSVDSSPTLRSLPCGAAINITQFASDDDDDDDDDTDDDEAEAHGGCGSTVSAPVSADAPASPPRRRVSEWLEMMRTPPDDEGATGGERGACAELQDSAGKKRFLRGGLAERAWRLQCREKSSIVFWRHHHRACASAAPSAVSVDEEEGGAPLKLRILTQHTECSLLVTTCRLMSPRQALFSTGAADSKQEKSEAGARPQGTSTVGELAATVSESQSKVGLARVPDPGSTRSPRNCRRDGPHLDSKEVESGGGGRCEDVGEQRRGHDDGFRETTSSGPLADNTVFALFAKDAVKHLKMRNGDTVHVFAPWLKLWLSSESGDRLPVVLCTRFVENLGGGGGDGSASRHSVTDPPRVLPRFSHSLGHNLACRRLNRQADLAPALVTGLFLGHHGATDSLLEALEWQQGGAVGPAGNAATMLCVRAVVQRVYHTRTATTATTPALSRKPPHSTPVSRTPAQLGAATSQHRFSLTRVPASRCVLLLQDSCGVFAELRADLASLPPGPSVEPRAGSPGSSSMELRAEPAGSTVEPRAGSPGSSTMEPRAGPAGSTMEPRAGPAGSSTVELRTEFAGSTMELRADPAPLPPGPSAGAPPAGATDSPPVLPVHLEGRCCLFADVAVLRRTTRTRSPALFSLIDSLWPPRQPPKAQPGSPHSPEESAEMMPAPSFCYVLATRAGSCVLPLSDDGGGGGAGTSALYRAPSTLPLSHTLGQRRGHRASWRCTFYATLIYAEMEEARPGGRVGAASCSLFVTDDSLQTPLPSSSSSSSSPAPPRSACVLVTASCVLPVSVRSALCQLRVASLLFKDVVCENDRLVATEGSLILFSSHAATKPTASAALQDTPLLDWLSPTSPENTLCLVQGVIIGVDEENAFSWLTCDRCGSKQLEKTRNFSGEVLHCVPCDAIVLNPAQRTNLSVLLSCRSLGPNRCANLKLLELTISKLLPARLSLFDEGYDPEALLGSSLGPLPCLVRTAPAWLAGPCELSEVALFGAI
ncbi:DNA repair-scaffolding protein [Lethenteron reissneri]|uniref:DNA repair-scaffolding protein n=1 Tax=Lethenteron reissneri TaxID=7753 RepID=UPI002AB7EC7C|nr:DNA repair-scaffolding protein [Lethenteron reissneri]